jgi:nicotinic acid mononucleotide adenylyltransferase
MNIMSSQYSDNIRPFIEILYSKDPKGIFSLYVTGGGAQILDWLFTVPGASSCVMNAAVPYSRVALSDALHHDDSLPCNEATAIKMAKAAYLNSLHCFIQDNINLRLVGQSNIFGVGCTAALRSATIKKGDHRFHVASYSPVSGCKTVSITLDKGSRSRVDEDYVCSRTILDLIASNADVEPMNQDYLSTKDVMECHQTKENCIEVLDRIRSGEISHALFIHQLPSLHTTSKLGDGTETYPLHDFSVLEEIRLPPGCLIYPGSFNPLHEGHIGLVLAALKKMGWTPTSEEPNPCVIFEISAVNADKPPLDSNELIQRVIQFNSFINPLFANAKLTNIGIAITSKPFFEQKSECFPSSKFLIGMDTFTRIINPKYYMSKYNSSSHIMVTDSNRSYPNMIASLTTICNRKCHFIVGGRISQNKDLPIEQKQFETLYDYIVTSNVRNELPDHVLMAFEGLTEDDFRSDISSTEIRNRMKKI